MRPDCRIAILPGGLDPIQLRRSRINRRGPSVRCNPRIQHYFSPARQTQKRSTGTGNSIEESYNPPSIQLTRSTALRSTLPQSAIPTQSRRNQEMRSQCVNGRPAIYRTRSGQTGRPSTYCDRISGSHSPITGHFRRHRQRMHRPTMSTQT